MRHILALLTVCLLNPGSTSAAEAVILTTGIEGFQVYQPAPSELLEKIGPLLDAAGTEELRVDDVAKEAGKADAVERAASPERAIRLAQFIRGLEVRDSYVNIVLNIQTNEVMLLNANFLPDRGLDHKPPLTAAQAKAKVETRMGESSTVELASGYRAKIAFNDTPAELAYDFEPAWGFRPARGMLVWVFGASGVDHLQHYQVSVSAATGEVIALHGMLVVN